MHLSNIPNKIMHITNTSMTVCIEFGIHHHSVCSAFILASIVHARDLEFSDAISFMNENVALVVFVILRSFIEIVFVCRTLYLGYQSYIVLYYGFVVIVLTVNVSFLWECVS